MERGRVGRPNEDCNSPHKNRGWQICREVSAKAAAGRLVEAAVSPTPPPRHPQS
ncbi:hypothetical protein HanRHA438_Chr11g0501531 [Helianthus annuus]|uniref:Uncharacterized protein n=1 Tax=Helianthus annuus TaxID=4232 RepID=A0A9K3N0B8_HELAN|nr:hypothetical protein HanXRQr2_Chr11g0488691 [Helianthus annuus]KAJ0501402.1 hypothetical protein HanHA300_Chr11g0400411 [Helianthus annuus]KAJ0509199.1 hypothetical protein HanIR_Chr11g0526131 [Helianthus annuus]KAJ0517310.1 hypothetical protein HanHA89_Chr11g0423931 [Helianthus annuus]KAJ0685321.1 hypothetical protein HanLR1_Chr11g0401381 [Helianthus annuus]